MALTAPPRCCVLVTAAEPRSADATDVGAVCRAVRAVRPAERARP